MEISMAAIARTRATLRIFGDNLDPSAVSEMLGVAPTSSYKNGDLIGRDSAGNEHFRHRGAWLLSANERTPGDVSGQVRDLISATTPDLSIWKALSCYERRDVFCGLFMEEGNEGEELEPDVLLALGERGLKLAFDIYDPRSD